MSALRLDSFDSPYFISLFILLCVSILGVCIGLACAAYYQWKRRLPEDGTGFSDLSESVIPTKDPLSLKKIVSEVMLFCFDVFGYRSLVERSPIPARIRALVLYSLYLGYVGMFLHAILQLFVKSEKGFLFRLAGYGPVTLYLLSFGVLYFVNRPRMLPVVNVLSALQDQDLVHSRTDVVSVPDGAKAVRAVHFGSFSGIDLGLFLVVIVHIATDVVQYMFFPASTKTAVSGDEHSAAEDVLASLLLPLDAVMLVAVHIPIAMYLYAARHIEEHSLHSIRSLVFATNDPTCAASADSARTAALCGEASAFFFFCKRLRVMNDLLRFALIPLLIGAAYFCLQMFVFVFVQVSSVAAIVTFFELGPFFSWLMWCIFIAAQTHRSLKSYLMLLEQSNLDPALSDSADGSWLMFRDATISARDYGRVPIACKLTSEASPDPMLSDLIAAIRHLRPSYPFLGSPAQFRLLGRYALLLGSFLVVLAEIALLRFGD